MSIRSPNSNAGPAAMPESVLETLQNDSAMSHRSSEFAEIAGRAVQNDESVDALIGYLKEFAQEHA